MDQTATPNAVLLHACCGPCSIVPVLRLRDAGYAPTAYFYNPNIQPLTEYLRRRDTLLELAVRMAFQVILAEAEDAAAAHPGVWLDAVARCGQDQEHRCPACYGLRLTQTARVARELGFARFTSTLLYSKYQNHQAILEAGARHATPECAFLPEDFRPGWDEGVQLSKEWGLYRQSYCGCVLSEYERYAKRLRQRPDAAAVRPSATQS